MITGYQYDMQDHLSQVTDGEGTVTSYQYSDRDLLTQETSEVSGITAFSYNEHREQTTKTDARGITEARALDELDRVTFVDYPTDSLDITYTYDDPSVDFSIGRLTSIERDGHSVDYAYDRFGRTIQDGELGYSHDKNGNRTQIVYSGGMAAVYTHDFADRESTLLIQEPGEPDVPIITASEYEPSGPLSLLERGNGLTESREHDTRYYPDSIVVEDATSTLLDWRYTTDAVGNPTSIADSLDPANNRTYDYQDYQYFLIEGDGPWGTRSWTYDRIGNRLTETRDGLPTDDYVYIQNEVGSNTPQLDLINLGVGGQRTYQYDAAGNQTQVDAAGNVIDRTYGDAGRMSSQERAAANSWTAFLYDGRGLLREAAGTFPEDAATSVFCDGFESGDTSAWDTGTGGDCLRSETAAPTYSSAGELFQRDRFNVIYYGGNPVLQFKSSQDFQHLIWDSLGTPVLAADAAGSLEWSGGFSPFGEEYPEARHQDSFLRFPGQWDDPAWTQSSLGDPVYLNVFRWYQVSTGSYSRMDPLGVIRDYGLMHPYGYAMSNPVFLLDDLGLDALTSSPSVLDCMFCLYAKSGQGLLPIESAAWITEKVVPSPDSETGSTIEYGCHHSGWVSDQGMASWPRGQLFPDGYVAFVHTHPTRSRSHRSSPRPSRGDKESARRVHKPVYTITPMGIFKYDPKTDKITKEAPSNWDSDPKSRCKKKDWVHPGLAWVEI